MTESVFSIVVSVSGVAMPIKLQGAFEAAHKAADPGAAERRGGGRFTCRATTTQKGKTEREWLRALLRGRDVLRLS